MPRRRRERSAGKSAKAGSPPACSPRGPRAAGQGRASGERDCTESPVPAPRSPLHGLASVLTLKEGQTQRAKLYRQSRRQCVSPCVFLLEIQSGIPLYGLAPTPPAHPFLSRASQGGVSDLIRVPNVSRGPTESTGPGVAK